MSETPGPGSRRDGVELQIDRVLGANEVQATVTVRCLRGPVRLNARFSRFRPSAQALDLKLTRAVVYRLSAAELGAGLTALVTLRGEGVQYLRSGTPASGWQVVQGANP